MTIRSSKRQVMSQLDELEKSVNDRNDIERGLLLVVFIAILFLGWQSLVWDGISTKRTSLSRQIRTVEAENETIQSRLEAVRKGMDIDPLRPLKEKRNGLRKGIKEASESLEAMTTNLVSQEDMRNLLVSVLEKSPRVYLKALQNVEGISLSGVDESKELAQYAMSIFKHGVRMTIAGDYFAVLNYLNKLEHLEHKLIWESMEYVVTDYPEAQVTLMFRTISDTEGYVGV
ncbi:MAG: hypothetical protein CMF48_00490 [Legionellales bacterium]|nr:hypothetical protein [Legionellales bacterium]